MEKTGRATVEGIPLLGIPDLHFKIHDTSVILDWKVNGFCSKSKKTPTPGYVANCDLFGDNLGMHKDVQLESMPLIGFIDAGNCLVDRASEWALQLVTYNWLAGVPVGDEILGMVDQLYCQDGEVLGVALHRSLISREFQETVFQQYKDLWDVVNSDWIFRNLRQDDSKALCAKLDDQAAAYGGTEEKDAWFRQMSGRGT